MGRYKAPVRGINSEITLDGNYPSSYMSMWEDVCPSTGEAGKADAPVDLCVFICVLCVMGKERHPNEVA